MNQDIQTTVIGNTPRNHVKLLAHDGTIVAPEQLVPDVLNWCSVPHDDSATAQCRQNDLVMLASESVERIIDTLRYNQAGRKFHTQFEWVTPSGKRAYHLAILESVDIMFSQSLSELRIDSSDLPVINIDRRIYTVVDMGHHVFEVQAGARWLSREGLYNPYSTFVLDFTNAVMRHHPHFRFTAHAHLLTR